MKRTFNLLDDSVVAGQRVLSPQVFAYVGRSDRWFRYPTLSIVDTGSPATIIETNIARACGVSDEEILAGEEQSFSGIGDQPEAENGEPGGMRLVAHCVTLDLALVATKDERPDAGLILRSARVFVSEGQRGIILGQHDFLERLRFEQRNYGSARSFDLEPIVRPRRALWGIEPD